jgi:hypothetical protein
MEYRNVAFVPFHTPHADSFDQSCAITSSIESGFRNTIWCGEGVGFVFVLILGGSGGGDDSLRRRERTEDAGVNGALEVKYAGSSGSESESAASGCWLQGLAGCVSASPGEARGSPNIGLLGLAMPGFVVSGGGVFSPPKSSWILTCRTVLATSKGWDINTDVYFHNSSSIKCFIDSTVEGESSSRCSL